MRTVEPRSTVSREEALELDDDRLAARWIGDVLELVLPLPRRRELHTALAILVGIALACVWLAPALALIPLALGTLLLIVGVRRPRLRITRERIGGRLADVGARLHVLEHGDHYRVALGPTVKLAEVESPTTALAIVRSIERGRSALGAPIEVELEGSKRSN